MYISIVVFTSTAYLHFFFECNDDILCYTSYTLIFASSNFLIIYIDDYSFHFERKKRNDNEMGQMGQMGLKKKKVLLRRKV